MLRYQFLFDHWSQASWGQFVVGWVTLIQVQLAAVAELTLCQGEGPFSSVGWKLVKGAAQWYCIVHWQKQDLKYNHIVYIAVILSFILHAILAMWPFIDFYFKAERNVMSDDLNRQRTLYNELKKMRGMGEEVELLRESQEVTTKGWIGLQLAERLGEQT